MSSGAPSRLGLTAADACPWLGPKPIDWPPEEKPILPATDKRQGSKGAARLCCGVTFQLKALHGGVLYCVTRCSPVEHSFLRPICFAIVFRCVRQWLSSCKTVLGFDTQTMCLITMLTGGIVFIFLLMLIRAAAASVISICHLNVIW